MSSTSYRKNWEANCRFLDAEEICVKECGIMVDSRQCFEAGCVYNESCTVGVHTPCLETLPTIDYFIGQLMYSII